MTMTNIRFNMVNPEQNPAEMAERYRAMLDIAAAADAAGVSGITLEEHHGAANGWSPTPLLNAGMILARTESMLVSISALLLPLHEPIRVAEDIAVLDLVSGGRLVTIFGLGYRPSEYALLDKDWAGRGNLMDECLSTVMAAWTGEPFEFRGETVQILPKPISEPHPMVMVGGTSRPAARRAARHGLPLFPAAHLPELEAYYYEKCEEYGTTGFVIMPSPKTKMMFVSLDPDATWAQHGQHFFHEASTYKGWQTADISSAVKSAAGNAEELREEGIYVVMTPEEAIAEAASAGNVVLHPLVGGMPVDAGWECINLFLDEVLPNI